MLRGEMPNPQPKAPLENEQQHEQQQADDRRAKDKTDKIERDRADEVGRRAREGT
jgi:hypothetical protein